MIKNEIRQSLSKVVKALNSESVEYMVIGGVAVASYGYYRVSGVYNSSLPEIKHDIDFWYNPTLSNFIKLTKALASLGVEGVEDIIFDRTNYLRINHDTFRTEFLPKMVGLLSFEESFQNAKKISIGDDSLCVIGYSDLIRNKTQLGRSIDQKDIEQLKKRNSDPDD
ncbi:MAG: hypothetical protein Roseis2KO_57250 [Roseivirga sp.]